MKKMLMHFIFCASLFLPISYAWAIAEHGMVVSEQRLASEVGINILKAGGNAIDAAVAVGYALAVVSPCCGNIGGGGFMTLHLADGKNIVINFRERAPLAAKKDMFLDDKGNIIPNKSIVGYLSVGVPGTVLGLETALKKYGTMTRQKVMAPAIALAKKGYVLTPYDIKLFNMYTNDFKKQPNIAAIFLKNNQPYKAGDRLIQNDLANTLKVIADKGPDVFYKGQIASGIVQASQLHGGILSKKDFADYHIEEMQPIICSYRGYHIISTPPPSSGGVTLCEILNILENYPLASLGYHSAQGVHDIVEAMRYGFYDRNNQLGDPDFVVNPIEHLLSKKYAKELQQKIQNFHAIPLDQRHESTIPNESINTTHYSVLDKLGNAVSVTYTLNSYFGAKVIAGNTGFFLNDEMDDFAIKPGARNQFGLVQGDKNAIQPGKRPLSSMAPTIITQGNQVVMILGSPGGPRIITATLQTILNVLDYKIDIQPAVNAPRFHYQWLPDVIDVEPNTFSANTKAKLTAMGYRFITRDRWGAVEAIYIDPKTKAISGANDNRRPAGKAIGY